MNSSPLNMPEKFRSDMRAAGLDYAGDIVADGKLHRFKALGDRRPDSWYVLHSDVPAAGAFGCWKRSVKEIWGERNRQLSQSEWNKVRQCWQDADRERERAETERHTKARKTAAWILDRAKPVVSHPYLSTKGVKVFGDVREYRGALVLPLRDLNGELHSLQFISPAGEKRFLSGGKIAGCFFTLDHNPETPLLICEGYATGASINEATGLLTICSMNCGNLLAVAKALREKCPQLEIVICADNDAFTIVNGQPKNSGLDAATETAKAIHAKLAVPHFKDTSTKPTDFNDLAALAGLAEVKRQIESAATPKETDDEIVQRLAGLPLLEYERRRDAEAEKLGISRVSILDGLVYAKRPKREPASEKLQGRMLNLPDVEPWPDTVNGADVLSDVSETFSRYVVLPSGAADALALWAAHAHCFESFMCSPRLHITSPEKGCGKTTLRDVLALFVPRPLLTENLTVAVLFRLIESDKPTVLADECDGWLKDNGDLRSMLNSGHRRGGRVFRCEGDGHEVRGFQVFAPAILCGIGSLPGTLHDRSIVIRLERAKPGEVRERFDSRHTERQHELCRKLVRFVADNRVQIESCDPKLPDGAFNRLADNWRPLFAVAEIAGGDWPRRAAAAFAKLTSREDSDAQGIGTALLADIASIFTAADADKLRSAEIVEALAKIEGREWADWGRAGKSISPNQLAKNLRLFSITPRTIKLQDGTTAKGYHREDFREAFERYLPQPPLPNRNPVTLPENISHFALPETLPEKERLRIETVAIANKNAQGYAVTDQSVGKANNELII
jgi:putative DNA primase/helicase